jgi:hypothetical protein
MKDDFAGKFSRRRFLKSAAIVGGVAAMSTISFPRRARADDSSKAPQAAVKYQDQPHNNQQCSECMYFQPPSGGGATGHCKVVQGDIAAKGWCMLFSPAQ